MVYGGGLGRRQKTMKTIFRMNGLFRGERARARGSEIERGETARERSAT